MELVDVKKPNEYYPRGSSRDRNAYSDYKSVTKYEPVSEFKPPNKEKSDKDKSVEE